MRKVSDFKIIVFLTIMAIVVIGLVACGGNDATNPSSLSQGGGSTGGGSSLPTFTERTNITFITNTGTVTNGNGGSGGDSGVGDLGDNNGDTGNVWNVDETKGKTFYGSTYRQIYVPWISPNWFKISYNDTDRLTRLWKAMIDRGRKDGQRRVYIKTHDGDLFFDANYNIRWSKQPDVILKRFQGGAIAQLREGYGNNVQASAEYGNTTYSGKYAISGLYTFADSLYNVNEKYHSDTINYFFGNQYNATGFGYMAEPKYTRYWTGTAGGVMERLALHPGYPVDLGTGLFRVNGQAGTKGWSGTAYALQSYLEKNGQNLGYRDGNHHLWNIKGNTPERYIPAMGVHQLYHMGFRWAMDKTYDPNNYPTDSAR